jgi:hypothetical protein
MNSNWRTRTFWIVGVIALGLLLAYSAGLFSDHKVTVGKMVSKNRRTSIDQNEHTLLTDFLEKYDDAKGKVDYRSWLNHREDVIQLDQYLDHLSAADPMLPSSENAKLAFWINAYNAVTIKGILREYPTSSIRNHTSMIGGYNVWHDLMLIVGDSEYSLDQIEHRILRTLGEPRIHFALVCASNGCPPLLNRAYTAKQLEAQLTANAKSFFANKSQFQFDDQKKTFRMSPILKWFKEDFGSDQATVLKSIAPYLPTTESFKAAMSNSVSVSYTGYDWQLNEQ